MTALGPWWDSNTGANNDGGTMKPGLTRLIFLMLLIIVLLIIIIKRGFFKIIFIAQIPE